jgi:flagellar protein FliJ
MTWRDALVRISTYDVDELRKRLAVILDRRMALDMKLVMLAAEAEAEMRHADRDAELRFYRAGFMQGVKARREAIWAEIEVVKQEEAGARDALSQAFEAQKKFERVAENARIAEAKQMARLETAAMDEIGLRATRA